MENQNQNSADKSTRGYYYNLSISPYEYMGLKFPSAKKLDVYIKKYVINEIKIKQYTKFINVNCDRELKVDELLIEMKYNLYESMKHTF